MKNKIIAIVLILLCSISMQAVANDTNAESIVPRVAVKYITLTNGVKLEYAEQGLASGTPIIFLHGYTDSWHSFQSILPHLPSNVHAFAISQRGHGDSDRPLTGYALSDFASDIADFMKQLKIGPAIIVGHSMGGIIAQQLTLDYPQLVKGLVIVSSTPQFVDNPEMTGFLAAINSLGDTVDPEFAKAFQAGTIVKPIDKTYFDTLVAESCKVPGHVWKAAMAAIASTNFTTKLPKITQPVLVFWGDKDNICFRSDQDLFMGQLSKAKLLVYEGIGHALHWEEPARFVKDLLAFARLNGLIEK